MDALRVAHDEVGADGTRQPERHKVVEERWENPAFCRNQTPCKHGEAQVVLRRASVNSHPEAGRGETRGLSRTRILVGNGVQREVS